MSSDNKSENNVRGLGAEERPDPDIAGDAAAAIRKELPISSDHINVVVVNGAATLEGHVEWQYQKNTAESKLRGLEGVRCVVNNIVLEPQSARVEIRHKIEEELGKAAEVEASRTRAEPADREAGSRGTLRSWAEHRETERYA